MIFIKFGKFLVIISSDFFNASFSFLSPSWILSVLYVGTVDSVPQDSVTQFIF